MLQQLQGYKTLIFNGLIALITVGAALSGHSADAVSTINSLTGSLDASITGVVGLIAAGNIVLRWFTTTPVLTQGKK